MTRRLRPAWYRNGTSGKFHAAGPRWIQTGKAVCSRSIARPGYEWSNDNPPTEVRCKDCNRKVAL